MNRVAYKRSSTDLRRLIKYKDIELAGHFRKSRVSLPGRLTNNWIGIFNIKNGKIIALYQIKNDICLAMIRRKSPYHMLIENTIRKNFPLDGLFMRKMPRTVHIQRLNYVTLGLRNETTRQRELNNVVLSKVLGKASIYDARTITRNPE